MNTRIIDHFLSLCAIPHPSHHEEELSRFLRDWALGQGLDARRDAAGNVIIDKSASPGREGAPRVILQAHMDMVAVAAEGVDFDPLRDSIRPVREGDILRAEGTSLGGDDGAGVALAMAILEDKEAVHGPLRAIFTVDEEDGMDGAAALAPGELDAAYLINLDWEEFGSLCCSSAGSEMYRLRRALSRKPLDQGEKCFSLTVGGLAGGHSGAQIHLGRGNAIRAAAEILSAGGDGLRLCAFRGGSAHNAIPTSAEARFNLPARGREAALAAMQRAMDAWLERCALTDGGAVVSLLESPPEGRALSAGESGDVLSLLTAVHDGVNTMSKTIPGLVESSANTGLAELEEEGFSLLIHQRSSERSVTETMRAAFAAQAEARGFSLERISAAPPWPVRPGSRLVARCTKRFAAMFGREMRVEPVHAGLECGSFAEKNPALDIISIGPDIRDIHTPRETLILPTVGDCDALVRALLRELSEA